MNLFGLHRVPLEIQLATLGEVGLTLSTGVTTDDLFLFHSRDAMEKRPYQGVVEVLGFEMEREPYSPICARLWMCDYERIEDHGDYAGILTRLERMTDAALGLTGVRDFVDVDAGDVWVEFDCDGETLRWEPKVEDDWMDPSVISNYDALLKSKGKELRIYANQADYGQAALFGAFTENAFRRFSDLSRVKLRPVDPSR